MKTTKPYCRACMYEYADAEEEKRGACFCRDFPEQQSYEPSVNRAGGGQYLPRCNDAEADHLLGNDMQDFYGGFEK